MATLTPTTMFSLRYGNGQLQTISPRVRSISDGNDSNYEFTVGESITIRFVNSLGIESSVTGTFKGTTTAISGGPYAVVEYTGDLTGNTFTIVVGTGTRGSITNPPATVTALNINTTDPLPAPCFLAGTLIATPSGERRVEDLVPGDPVLIEDADAIPATWSGRLRLNLRRRLGIGRSVPVKWIGRQTVSTRFGPAERLMPVRFTAGSLGGGGGEQLLLPHSDLTVTADHAMLVDGVLCEAGTLVNGTTITRVPLSEFGDSYAVYHVETEAHEILLANGAPAETFIDNISRRAFENYAEFEKLHGDPPEMAELPNPRASNARHLPARIRSRLGIGSAAESANVA